MSVMLALTLPGCAEGWEASADEARAWLPGASTDLKRVIVLLRTCRPTRPSGYNTVWANGDDGGGGPIRCAIGNGTALAEMQDRMRKAGVIGVSYYPSDSVRRPVPSASFFLFREGIVTSGSSTTVDYTAASRPCRSQVEGDKSFSVRYEPLTKAPCRWFWSHSEG